MCLYRCFVIPSEACMSEFNVCISMYDCQGVKEGIKQLPMVNKFATCLGQRKSCLCACPCPASCYKDDSLGYPQGFNPSYQASGSACNRTSGFYWAAAAEASSGNNKAPHSLVVQALA